MKIMSWSLFDAMTNSILSYIISIVAYDSLYTMHIDYVRALRERIG